MAALRRPGIVENRLLAHPIVSLPSRFATVAFISFRLPTQRGWDIQRRNRVRFSRTSVFLRNVYDGKELT